MARFTVSDLYDTAQKIVSFKTRNLQLSSEEKLNRIEGLVNIYKHNREVFVNDFKQTHLSTVVHRPFTESEILTFKGLRYAVSVMNSTTTTTVDSLHKSLIEILTDYPNNRSRTYQILESGHKVGLFAKHKVGRNVAYKLTQEASETKIELFVQALVDYGSAAKAMNLGKLKLSNPVEDWLFELEVMAAEKTVNFYQLGHY